MLPLALLACRVVQLASGSGQAAAVDEAVWSARWGFSDSIFHTRALMAISLCFSLQHAGDVRSYQACEHPNTADTLRGGA